ncbi:carbohydrate sulfotransferase 15-like [Haliotis rufescens]|uniref:carbohydrate sulfotransferase 15-like n=1 Tax=Haliotis rufescens TaxID=6454 RepID=UPI00201F8702|nr:carbohydrate sulfotransferase 15-like [Haliotis rufescens]
MERPAFLQNYKNPCWYSDEAGQRELRCLPYYHILGVSKSGTIDLSARIRAHEDVLGCGQRLCKNMYYWSNGRYGDGTPTDFYRFYRWEDIPQNAGLTEPVVVTPHLMKHVYKDPKFIIIFRNPTDRLYSDYIFLNQGDSPQSFHKHVLQAIQIEEECMRNNTMRRCLYSLDVSKQLPTRIFIGYYSVYMKEWLNVFRRENFLILRTEDYNHDMKGTLRKVYDYLKLNYNEEFLTSVVNIPHMHVTENKKKAGPMLKETRLLLDKLYRPYLEELAVLLQDKRFLWLT